MAALQDSNNIQKQDYELTIKEKTTAFSKAQDEMQRLLDEEIANRKKQVTAVQDQNTAQQKNYEGIIAEKTDAFTMAKEQLEKSIEDLKKRLEQVSQMSDVLSVK